MSDDQASVWPQGVGEMAARIRAHEWTTTPLGPTETWPQSLKTVVDLMLGSPSMMSLVWSAEAVHIYNDRFIELLSEQRAEALGRSAFETFARSREVFAADVAAGMSGNSARLLAQHYPVLRNGRLEDAWFDVDYAPVRDESGRVAGVLWTLKETTAQVLAERVLRESDARHRLLIGSWAQAVWESDPNGVVTADSPSWRAYTGQTLDEWLGYGWLNAIHPDDRAHAERQWREAIAAREYVNAELRLRSPDGGWRWTNIRAAPVLDAKGNIEKWAGMNIDIHVRKGAEAAWRESEERQTFLLQLSDALRPLADPARIQDTATRILGQHLRANRVAYVQVTDDEYIIERDYVNGVPSMAGRFRVNSYGTDKVADYLEGRTRVVRDTERDARNDPVATANFAAFGVAAGLGVPLIKEGRFVASLVVHMSEPRDWTRVEIMLAEETAERTWAAVERAHVEATLRESEERLRLMTDAMPVLISYIDERLCYRFANKRYEEWFGRKPEEVNGRSVRELVGDAAFEHLRPHAEAALTGERRGFEAEMPFKFGGMRHVRTEFVPDIRGDGSVAGYYSLVVDITDRKRAEAALVQSEERLRGFGEASTDVLWIRDGETLAWTYLTPAFETIYGMSREDALGGDDFRTWLDLIVPDDREKARSNIERVRNGERVTFEYRIKRPIDGAIRWLRNTDFPIQDDDGRITAIGGVGHDASQEKDADRIIRASRRQLRTLVEGMAQLVWRAVACGDWTWASPQWTAYTGQSSEASTGRGWLAMVHPDDHEQALDAWRWTEETKEPLDVEYRIKQASDGTYRWFRTRALPVKDEETGEITEWLGTSTDIDDLRELQDSQTVMVTELQHRTRNLIAVVSSIARQTMTETGPTEAFRAAFADRMEALSRVQGLLSQAGEERVTMHHILEMELAALGTHDFDGRIRVSGPDVPLRKSIVQTLTLAIHELATNARKYGALSGKDGALDVRWTTSRAENEERRLYLEWIESGITIEMDDGEAVTRGTGYGRKLIEKSLPYSLKARTTYVLGPDGLRCTIDLPLTKHIPKEHRS